MKNAPDAAVKNLLQALAPIVIKCSQCPLVYPENIVKHLVKIKRNTNNKFIVLDPFNVQYISL